jgi:CO/xanthine dehydrogenase Mo-binding subunit
VVQDLTLRYPGLVERQVIYNGLAPVITETYETAGIPGEQLVEVSGRTNHIAEHGEQPDELAARFDNEKRLEYIKSFFFERVWRPGASPMWLAGREGFDDASATFQSEQLADEDRFRASMGYYEAASQPHLAEVEPLLFQPDPEETYSNGCTAAVVEVDVETGMVRIEQMVPVEDCGTVLNPMIVEGQVAGAVAMGIGMALLEELVYDEQGEFASGSLLHYLFPSTGEVPHMDIRHIETPSPATVGGVKGVGEGGTIATPAAIVNAISDAISPFGVSVEQTPVTPDYLLGLLRSAREG